MRTLASATSYDRTSRPTPAVWRAAALQATVAEETEEVAAVEMADETATVHTLVCLMGLHAIYKSHL